MLVVGIHKKEIIMDNTEKTSNVVQFPKRPLFNEGLRKKMLDSIKDKASNTDEVIETLENVICSHLVGFVREGATKLGERLGEKIGKMLVKNA
jgi:hypothetical protein